MNRKNRRSGSSAKRQPASSRPAPSTQSSVSAMPEETEVSASFVRTQSFRGPLPPPALLEQYESIQPGLAKRIITLAEKQQEHRFTKEREVLGAAIVDQRAARNERRRGQFLGFSFCVIVVICATLATVQTQGNAQPEIFAATLGSLAIICFVFMTGRWKSDSSSEPNAQDPQSDARSTH